MQGCFFGFSFTLPRPNVFPATPKFLSSSLSPYYPNNFGRWPYGEKCYHVHRPLSPVLQYLVELTGKISPSLTFSWSTCFNLYIESQNAVFSIWHYRYCAQKQFFLIYMCLPERPFLKDRGHQCCPFLYHTSTLRILLQVPY